MRHGLTFAYVYAYNEYMDSIQYTIRAVPPRVDQVLRKQARATGKSLNTVAIEALTKATGASSDADFDDLDWFVGNASLGDSFVEAIEWLDRSPRDIG